MRNVVPSANPSDSISVIIPFHDDGQRGPAFEWVRDKWKQLLPTAEIVVGTDRGVPFSKTTAVNDALRRATGEVLVVTDADAWLDPDALENGIKQAQATGKLVVPWRKILRFNQAAAEKIMAGEDVENVRRQLEHSSPEPRTAATIFIIRRDALLSINGMDSRFRGWGYEDVSFRRACDALLGRSIYTAGEGYTLWHPRTMGVGRTWGESDPGKLNSELNGRYVKAERKPGVMRALVDEDPL